MSDDTVPNEPEKDDHSSVRLPSIIDGQKGEVVVALQPEGVLVGGDPDAVDSYLSRLRDFAGQAVQVAGIDKASLGNAAGLLAGAASLFGQAGKFVQLHPESYRAIKQGNLIPGTDGFYRMMTRGADNKFLQQLQWKPAAANPAQLMSAELIGVQLALKAAVSEVEEAVRRVEGKVDRVLKLAQASRAGDVLGNHTTISRRIEYLETHGSLPDAMWESVATLGPALNRTVEQLRNHIEHSLASFNEGDPVQDRAKALGQAVKDGLLSETLSLLVVTEESLYQWRRLLLARVEATEPEHLDGVIADSRQLLAQQLEADGALYRRAAEVIASIGTPKTIEGFRFLAVRELAQYRKQLRQDLDDFARARHNQVCSWQDPRTPTLRDAANAAAEVAQKQAGRALAAAGQGLVKVGDLLAERHSKKEAMPADPPAEHEDTAG
jgi:hypothetical protein